MSEEELFCDSCSEFIGKDVYIVVGRGILLGITETLEEVPGRPPGLVWRKAA